jgi:homoserine dehydrogenase
VLSKVAQIFSDAGISIEALIQKEPQPGQDHVPLILLTNRTHERRIVAAVGQLEALDSIDGEVVRIRMESLAG